MEQSWTKSVDSYSFTERDSEEEHYELESQIILVVVATAMGTTGMYTMLLQASRIWIVCILELQ